MRAVVEAGKGLVTPRLLVAKAAKSKQAAMDLAHVLVARPFHRRKAAWVERVCCTGEARWQLRTVLLNCRREKAQGKDCCIKVKCWQERASARMLASELTHTRIKLMWCCKHREKITWKSTWV